MQISQTFRDRESGELRKGKTLVLDREDMALHPEAREFLARVLDDWAE